MPQLNLVFSFCCVHSLYLRRQSGLSRQSLEEVACSTLEPLLHERARVGSVVFFAAKPLFLFNSKCVSHATSHAGVSRAEACLGMHIGHVSAEALESLSSGPECSWVRHRCARQSGPVVVHNPCVVVVDLESLMVSLVVGWVQFIPVVVVQRFSVSVQEILLHGLAVNTFLVCAD